MESDWTHISIVMVCTTLTGVHVHTILQNGSPINNTQEVYMHNSSTRVHVQCDHAEGVCRGDKNTEWTQNDQNVYLTDTQLLKDMDYNTLLKQYSPNHNYVQKISRVDMR